MMKAGTTYGAWMKAGVDLWMLGAEACTAMTLRMVRIAAGGSAGVAETDLMVSAAINLQTRLMTGGLGLTPLGIVQGSVTHYRRKVAANRKRLGRG